MLQYCYLCNKEGNNWPKNLCEIKSKHSNTPVSVFIEKFLKDFVSQRNINDESNCLCSDCLSEVYSYDWMTLKLKEQETKLRALLLKSETDFVANFHIKTEDEGSVNGLKNEKKPELPNVVADNAKKSKPIIIRVVKRVPFLKSKPPTSGTVHSITPVATITSGITQSIQKPIQTPGPQKKIKIIKIKPQVCKYCDAKFKHYVSLETHMKLHTKSSGLITCHICSYQMSIGEEEAFKNHAKKHDKATPKKCVICDEGGADNFDLKYHVQRHHSSANLLCDVCGKTFVFISALRKHHQVHIEDRNEICPFCDKAFKQKQAFNRHMRTHTEMEAIYSCAFCDKKFKRQDNCRTHEKRHRNDTKKFKCTFCSSAFEFKHDFNLHLQRKHNAEIPHEKNRK
ncbi:gastrula zinc finger protein XlCGF26.1-like [Contarinia nasturtii]|uniref:gastrula zinc finger protein XlCGF26.1-like n=1 Tax=Contarinia nasturtii TaxID=265458 RepID=UPI0012D3D5CD|nr:gastrula zinc finger protein XlCGF26.1-like [Contarinia nasturtii]